MDMTQEVGYDLMDEKDAVSGHRLHHKHQLYHKHQLQTEW